MTIEAALRAYLAAQTMLTDRVGDRIAVDTIRQGAETPYIIIELNGTNPEYHTTGEVDIHASMLDVRYVGAGRGEAEQYKSSRDLGLIVRPLLSGFRGTWGDMEIHSCLIREERPTVEFPQDGQEFGPASYTHSLMVWHKLET